MNEALAELGAALHRGRLAQGMSLRGWAKALGMAGHSGLVDYERGTRLPPADIVEASERIFQLPPGQLVALRRRALAARADAAAARLLAARHDPLVPRPPAQLPADLATFTGRRDELSRLLGAGSTGLSTVVISAIDGMAGIGKTVLAVHAAHRLAGRYQDGQLFINLHGYTEAVAPVQPADALDRLLRALGIPGERIPDQLDDRAALWRSTLAGRRMLIVLDNAVTEAQVTPLVPGTPGCLVLVTSRHRLASLESTQGLSLDVLPPADAITLLVRTTTKGRLAGVPPDRLAELIELCGRLPLAIRIAAARLASHPSWAVADLVERLRDSQRRPAELAAGQHSVAAALDLSYRALVGDQQRAYRLLGLHPGPDFNVYAAAALAGTSVEHAGRLLDGLLDGHLLQEHHPGRYAFHDLTGAHAVAIATRGESGPDRRAALARLLDLYRHTTSAAVAVAYPYERPRLPRVPPARVSTPDLPDPGSAIAWLDAELANLLATAQYAVEHGRPGFTLHLSAILHQHLRTRGRFADAKALHAAALAAAPRSRRRFANLGPLLGLGDIHRLQGRWDLAIDHIARALDIARAAGYRIGELEALIGLGRVHWLQGRYDEAAGNFRRVLDIARAVGHRVGELDALRGLARVHRLQGQYNLAFDYFRRVLDLARATSHRTGELDALNGLGEIHFVHGRYDQASDRYLQVLDLARSTGNHTDELGAMLGLGRVNRLQARYEQAADYLARAAELAYAAGSRTAELNAVVGLGDVQLQQGRYGPAAARYRRALDLARAAGSRNWQFEAIQGLGRVGHAIGRQEEARGHHQRALELATELGQPADQARAHDGLAHALQALDQPVLARAHWQQALEILANIGIDQTEEPQANTATIRAHLAKLAG